MPKMEHSFILTLKAFLTSLPGIAACCWWSNYQQKNNKKIKINTWTTNICKFAIWASRYWFSKSGRSDLSSALDCLWWLDGLLISSPALKGLGNTDPRSHKNIGLGQFFFVVLFVLYSRANSVAYGWHHRIIWI